MERGGTEHLHERGPSLFVLRVDVCAIIEQRLSRMQQHDH